MGFSEGGRRAAYLAAMDDRVRATVVSGYFSSLPTVIASWENLSKWDICNYVPGLLRYADLIDILALISPRPLLIQIGTQDPLGVYLQLQSNHRPLGSTCAQLLLPLLDNIQLFEGGHILYEEGVYEWLEEQMRLDR
jgi:hypothetical protein